MNSKWYARFPVLCGDEIYFVAGDDLFKVAKKGGHPELCFSSTSSLEQLFVSPDGKKIVCVSKEDGGPDIYVFDLETRDLNRLTFQEASLVLLGFEGDDILFLSNKDSAFRKDNFLYKQKISGGLPEKHDIGPINWMHKDGDVSVFQRYGYGYINWKGYRGGTVGSLWVKDEKGCRELINLPGNALRPILHEGRVFFLNDANGGGNIYSCKTDGSDYKQNTFHNDFYVRDLQKCGTKFLYSNGGRIGIFENGQSNFLPLLGSMPHPDGRSFMPEASRFLTSADTNGHKLVCAIRGHVFCCGNWSGGMYRLSENLRFRHSGFLNNSKVYGFKDPPEPGLSIFDPEMKEETKNFNFDFGKVILHVPSPKNNYIAYSNHRNELHIFDYEKGEDVLIVKAFDKFSGFDWSFDGKWLVYSVSVGWRRNSIRLYNVETKQDIDLTNGDFLDGAPVFDPEGKYIFFLSNRFASCSSDGLRFGWVFDEINKPYLITLQKDHIPLMPWADEKAEFESEKDKAGQEQEKDEKNASKEKEELSLHIDLDGISERIAPLPVENRDYTHLYAISDGRLLMQCSKSHEVDDDEDELSSNSEMRIFHFKTLSEEMFIKNLSAYVLSIDKQNAIIWDAQKIKIAKAGEKCEEERGYKKGGFFDWSRWRHFVKPKEEWLQMMHEVWWLMKEFYWSPNMAGLNWGEIWEKYKPFINNIRTRQELNDLFDEIQGELGTSHAYVLDSGLNEHSHSKVGRLGAEFAWDKNEGAYKIKKILKSDFAYNLISPLSGPGMNCEGLYLYKIDGQKLNESVTPELALVGKVNTWVSLEIGNKESKNNFEVKTIASERGLIYREFIEQNRKFIDESTNGEVGYIHIPDMQLWGFKEFFQNYIKEFDKKSLIIDARYNGGGNISCILIDQLRRRRLGVDIPRWGKAEPWPFESSRGNFVLLVNPYTGSDGDLFAKQFKSLELGATIGERTWGGVFGIMPRHRLIDGGLTSQPEFGFWLSDDGYSLENKGVMPDIEVKNEFLTSFEPKNDLQLLEGIKQALKIEDKSNFEDIFCKDSHPNPRDS